MISGRSNARTKSLYAMVAAALLAVLVMPMAVAGAKKGPSKNAAVTAQIKKLTARITALENRQAPAQNTSPSGPAGGDLTGTYPNPTIAQNAVSGLEVEENSIGGNDIVTDSLGKNDLALDSVGASELGNITTVRSANGVGIAANQSGTVSVTCPAGTAILSGGHAWTGDQAGTSIIASAPDENNDNTTWVVQGRTSASNTLYAWANCLDV